jgi:anti-sigma regulatory factor (Ser/Thr protein kinase)
MLELALHVLDIAENSMRAGATLLTITITEDTGADMLSIEITDNGRGMNTGLLEQAADPFFTTKQTRRIGLGLPMFAQAARASGGEFHIASAEGTGTTVRATFRHSHIDRQPLGDIPGAVAAMIPGNAQVDIVLNFTRNGHAFRFDTRVLRAELDGLPLDHPDIVRFVRDSIREGLGEVS